MPASALRVVVIDACRNNSFRGDLRGLKIEERSAMLIVYSTRQGRTAEDGVGRNSPFAAAFIEALKTQPRQDVRLLFGSVSQRMAATTRQEPELISRLQSGAVLALAP